jgi:DNA-directed RNA polymerase subunit RPC12/RpoP
MGITDDIRSAIASKILICHETTTTNQPLNVPCIICKKEFAADSKLYLYVKGEGNVCQTCGERFAPETHKIMLEFKDKDIRELLVNNSEQIPTLTAIEWNDIEKNLNSLVSMCEDLAKGVSRGIVEAPAGHIGLLYLAKDIVKPERKSGESEKDYELRVKSFRIQKLHEKIKAETSGKVLILRRYFEKMGLPQSAM